MEESFNNLKKLFCTFTPKDSLEETLFNINKRYSVLFNKIFVLEIENSKELVCTYNIDTGNVRNIPLSNTILMHRKKETNTLYTINALNHLILDSNGKLDKNYIINWKDYKNSILLNNNREGFRKLNTKLYNIINL